MLTKEQLKERDAYFSAPENDIHKCSEGFNLSMILILIVFVIINIALMGN